MPGPESLSEWDRHLFHHPEDAYSFEVYEPTAVYPVIMLDADATVPDCMPPLQEPRYRHTEVFPDELEERQALINEAFVDWFTEENPQRAGGLLQQIQLLLTKESLKIDVQANAEFDKWVNWIHQFTDSQATLMFVVPRALDAIQDDKVATEYAWRALLHNSPLHGWRPIPGSEEEYTYLWGWRLRFEGTSLGEFINDILVAQEINLIPVVEDVADLEHE